MRAPLLSLGPIGSNLSLSGMIQLLGPLYTSKKAQCGPSLSVSLSIEGRTVDRIRELVLLLVPARVLCEPGQALVNLGRPTYSELYPWMGSAL